MGQLDKWSRDLSKGIECCPTHYELNRSELDFLSREINALISHVADTHINLVIFWTRLYKNRLIKKLHGKINHWNIHLSGQFMEWVKFSFWFGKTFSENYKSSLVRFLFFFYSTHNYLHNQHLFLTTKRTDAN